jgi:hypothetical protein
MYNHSVTKATMAVIVAAITFVSGVQFYQHRHYQLPIVAGPGVTKVINLSDYCESLRGSGADTKVFFLQGKEEGGKVLIMANTHSTEVDAILAALIFIENATVEKGTLIVIPQLNSSASSHRVTQVGVALPRWISGRIRMFTCIILTNSCCPFWMHETPTAPGPAVRMARSWSG